MQRSTFDIERLRLEGARELPPECFADFQRLSRSLLHGPPFQWLLVDAPMDDLRAQVRAVLDRVLLAAGQRITDIRLDEQIEDVPAFERQLAACAATSDVVHVMGRRHWFDVARWDALNARRERIAANVHARVVLWLDTEAIEASANVAPDLWAWRGGVYAFHTNLDTHAEFAFGAATSALPSPLDSRSMAVKQQRLTEIEHWLHSHRSAPAELLGAAYEELGNLLFDLGYHEEALRHWQEVELPFHRQAGASPGVVRVLGNIADLHAQRGLVREALEIWRRDVLPLHEAREDDSARIDALGKIAEALLRLGETDEALRINREERLPLAERLGDRMKQAGVIGSIAKILGARGDIDEALLLRQSRQLPLLEAAGTPQLRAIAASHVASLFSLRGEHEEAARIYREQVLPMVSAPSDVALRALMQNHLAMVLRAKGEIDQALHLLTDEALPVFTRLGDVEMRAATLGAIARLFIDQGRPAEALQILADDVLPTYERLNDGAALAQVRLDVAVLLLRRDPADVDVAMPLLASAYEWFEQAGTSRAAAALSTLRELGVEFTRDEDGVHARLLRDVTLPGAGLAPDVDQNVDSS